MSPCKWPREGLMLWCPFLFPLDRENQTWTWIPHYKEEWVTCNNERDLVLQYGVKLQTSSFKTVLFIVKGSLYGLDFWLTVFRFHNCQNSSKNFSKQLYFWILQRSSSSNLSVVHWDRVWKIDIPPQLVNCGAILGFDCIRYMCFYLWLSVGIWIGSVIHNILA